MTSRRTRERMVQRLQDQGIRDARVLAVLSEIPRHLFLDEALSHRAYEDTALPIGYQQTLSQPWIVARMTELVLAGRPALGRVLEIGSGSGYQTAVLSRLADEVIAVERIRPLLEAARGRGRTLRLRNVRWRLADGSEGCPGDGPFDAILVAAAPEVVSRAWLEQLDEGGRLVAPVGRGTQYLQTVTRTGDDWETRTLDGVRFVPLLPGVRR